jgi:predicted nuclease of predicted toxin-antitoxin system
LKFTLDENMPADLAALLGEDGYDVIDVFQKGLGGANEPPVLAAAVKERRILMTFDLDFSDSRQYPPGTHAGIVVFRLYDQCWSLLEKPVTRLLESGELRSLNNGLAIVDESRVRWKRPKKKGTLRWDR